MSASILSNQAMESLMSKFPGLDESQLKEIAGAVFEAVPQQKTQRKVKEVPSEERCMARMWPKDTYDEEGNYIYGKPGQCCRRKKGNKEALDAAIKEAKATHIAQLAKLKASEDADTAEAIAAADASLAQAIEAAHIKNDYCAQHQKQAGVTTKPLQFTNDGPKGKFKRHGLFHGRIDEELPFHDEQGHLVIFWNTPEVHDWVQAQKESGTYKGILLGVTFGSVSVKVALPRRRRLPRRTR